MRLSSFVVVSFFLLLLSSCVSQSEHDRLRAENETLKEELEEQKFGTARLLKAAQDSEASGD